MPWEVTIRRSAGESLGSITAVLDQVQAALPGVQLYREPSGADRVAAARARGVEFPDPIRQIFERQPARVRAVLEENGVSVLLYGFEADPLVALHAEVRGDGDPVPILAAVCRPRGWIAVDDAAGQPVDLAGAAAGWEAFRAYRERAVSGIHAPGGGEPAESGAAPDRRVE